MSIFRMAERLSGRWPDSQGFCGVREFDEPQGLEADEKKVRTLVQTHDDATVLVAIEATQGWSLRRALGVIRRRFGFG